MGSGSVSGHRFQALDSCRGACAVMVMLFHMDALTHFYGWAPVRNAWVAVDFFFVLSGFVIASAYGGALHTGANVRSFAIRRFGRLYPLHAFVLAVYVVIELARLWLVHAPDAFTQNTSIPSLFENVLLVQGFTPNHETWNYPAWSASVELWTNLAFALLAWSAGRSILILTALLAAALGAFVTLAPDARLPISQIELNVLLDASRSAFGFLLGMLAFSFFTALQNRRRFPPRSLELIAALIIAIAFIYPDDLPGTVPPMLFAAAVFVLAFERGAFSDLLKNPVGLKLGRWSYSIYLTHSLYLLAMEWVVYAAARHLGIPPSVSVGGEDLLSVGGPWTMDAVALCVVAAVVVGSSLTYRYIEEPARLYFNRLSEKLGQRYGGASEPSNRVTAPTECREEQAQPIGMDS